MSIRDFIKENKDEIDKVIHKAAPNCTINNEERRLWVLNDYGLYCWARASGVRI